MIHVHTHIHAHIIGGSECAYADGVPHSVRSAPLAGDHRQGGSRGIQAVGVRVCVYVLGMG